VVRMPGAEWVGPHHDNGEMQRYDVVCLHTIVGNPPAHAAHFSVRSDGHIFQSRDTLFKSAANKDGNHRVIAIENDDWGPPFPAWDDDDGHAVPGFTSAQVEANAKICAWAYKMHGIPLIACPNSRPSSRGIGYHRQGIDGNFIAEGYAYGGRIAGGEKWTLYDGKACPGDRRIAQRAQIIRRARELAGLDRGGFMPELTPDQQEDLYAGVKEIRTKVRNIEQFVEPPDDWTVRVQWLATAFGALRTTDIPELREQLTEVGEKLDELMTRVPDPAA
jgi:hypothetical protein